MADISKYSQGKELFDDQYKLLHRLSTAGGSADVWLALAVKTIDSFGDDTEHLEETGMKVAIKIYRPANALDIEGEQRFRDEFKIVYNCHHANLLQPTHFSIFEDCPYLVMPYCKDGSAEKLVGHVKDYGLLWKFIYDVSSGLAYLHKCVPPIIHQDIKPANVLIDQNGNYVITDFGISAKLSNPDSYYEDASSGTESYMAPEKFSDKAVPKPESDIWAFGATLYEILTGDLPFNGRGGIAQSEGCELAAIDASVPVAIRQLVYECLNLNPDKRPTAERISEFAKSRGKKRRFVWLAFPVICLLGLMMAFIPIMQFSKLCDSGDSIIEDVMEFASSDDFEIRDADYSSIVRAEAIYKEALSSGLPVKRMKEPVSSRMERIERILGLYVRYREVKDTVSMTVDLDMPEQHMVYMEKADIIKDIIKQNILDL